MDPRTRAEKLDQSLEIITRLWRGEPVQVASRHFSIRTQGPKLLPRDVKIPVWVAGKWPARQPMRRAARWDGMFPLRSGGGALTPEECTALLAIVSHHRTAPRPFDLVLGVRSGTLETKPDTVRAYGAAGVTWWFDVFAG